MSGYDNLNGIHWPLHLLRNSHDLPLFTRLQRCREDAMMQVSFGGCSAVKRLSHSHPAMRQFVAESRPHLKQTIREAKFKNAAGDGRIDRFIAQIKYLPGLFSAGFICHG